MPSLSSFVFGWRVAVVAAVALASFVSAAARAEVRVNIDFGKPLGPVVDRRQLGLNLFQIYDPAFAAGNAAYRANLAAMRPGLVRLHSWEMMGDAATTKRGWVLDGAKPTYRWDADKIKKALAGAWPWAPVVMMNIAAWPAHLGSPDQPLAAANHDAFAAFCASLVRIVNVDAKLGVRYWEVPNEWDDVYKGRGAELAALFVKAARAMKAVDPTIRVGGPALIQPWAGVFEDFAKGAAAHLDFVSYHTYATGDKSSSTTDLLKNAHGLGGIVADVGTRLSKLGLSGVETFHDEYNISWAPPDPRMNDVTSALYDALAMMSFARAGITGAAAWNEADGWYGKLDADMKPRPAAHVFGLFNTRLRGAIVAADSSGVDVVTPLAAKSEGGAAVSLVNRTGADETVRLVVAGVPAGPWRVEQVTASGLTRRAASHDELTATEGFRIPARSVTMLSTGADDAGDAGAPDDGAARDAAPVADSDAALPAPDAATHDGASPAPPVVDGAVPRPPLVRPDAAVATDIATEATTVGGSGGCACNTSRRDNVSWWWALWAVASWLVIRRRGSSCPNMERGRGRHP